MRIPILFGRGEPDEADAWLVEQAEMPGSGYAVRFTLPLGLSAHPAGCGCCTLRGPAADALTRMYRDRSVGTAPFFKRIRVLASAAGEALIRDAIAHDLVTRARYRLGG